MSVSRRRFLASSGVAGLALAASGCPHTPPASSQQPGVSTTPSAGVGRALALGLNRVDPNRYAGWAGELLACEADANDMGSIARANRFTTTVLLTDRATREAVKGEIRQAAQSLPTGGTFMLSYSGHGGQVDDASGEEVDRKDETWCLFDGEMLDDELFELWSGFAPGVRILVFSDSCHSGTVIKTRVYRTLERAGEAHRAPTPLPRTASPEDIDKAVKDAEKQPIVAEAVGGPRLRYRAMPPDVERRIAQDPRLSSFYRDIQRRTRVDERSPIGATVLLISGCQDNQLSLDGDENGLFTGTLKEVYGGVNTPGGFNGDYHAFHNQIQSHMPPSQSPNYFVVGAPNPSFERQRVFAL